MQGLPALLWSKSKLYDLWHRLSDFILTLAFKMPASVKLRAYEMGPKLSNCLRLSLNQHDDVRGCVDTMTSQRPKLETDAQQRTWKDRIKCNF